jgi:hypothetical protein
LVEWCGSSYPAPYRERSESGKRRGNTVGQLATQLSPFIRGKGEDFSLDKPPLLVEEYPSSQNKPSPASLTQLPDLGFRSIRFTYLFERLHPALIECFDILQGVFHTETLVGWDTQIMVSKEFDP